MLASKFALRDVDDLEAFVERVVVAHCRCTQATLSYHQREDLTSYLLGEAWRISEKFDPHRKHGVKFKGVLYSQLRLRAIDWTRLVAKRTRWQWSGGKVYERERQVAPLSLNAGVNAGDPDGHTLGDTLATKLGDPENSGTFSAGGLFGGGDSRTLGDHQDAARRLVDGGQS